MAVYRSAPDKIASSGLRVGSYRFSEEGLCIFSKGGIGKDEVDVMVFVSFMVNETIPEVETSSFFHIPLWPWSLGEQKLAQT